MGNQYLIAYLKLCTLSNSLQINGNLDHMITRVYLLCASILCVFILCASTLTFCAPILCTPTLCTSTLCAPYFAYTLCPNTMSP